MPNPPPPASNSNLTWRAVVAGVGGGLSLAAAALAYSSHWSHRPPSVEPSGSETAEVPAATAAFAVHLAEQYRVAPAVADLVVTLAYTHAAPSDIDPLLVLAIIGVESSLNPRAVSEVGAQGLMQIMPNIHAPRLRSRPPAANFFDPAVNISVGVEILRELIDASGGDVRAALQRYNGSTQDREARYAQRVFAERERLQGLSASRG